MKELVLLDTDVVSFILKKHKIAIQYRALASDKKLAISYITVGEMFEGALRANWDNLKIAKLTDLLLRYKIFYADWETAKLWGEIRAQRKHQPISANDAWIAATALRLDIPLMTHNAKDFVGIKDLEVISFQRE